jgi:hypothetical protein
LKRRRHSRFALTQPWWGEFRTSRDVVIEGIDSGALVIKSVEPVRRDEIVTLGFPGGGLEGRAAASTPSIAEGLVCHRVRIEPDGLDLESKPDDRSIVAVLWRAIPVTVVEVSRSGCLFHTQVPVEPGLIGRLHVVGVRQMPFEDGARIAWCQPRAGAGSLYHVGVELLPLAPPTERFQRSMQDALQMMETRG